MFQLDDVTARGTEDRLCQLAAWVREASQGGLRFGLDLPAARIPAQSGPAQLHRCLRALALHGLGPAERA
jgi:uncharacterized protein (DUF58 family)